MIYHAGPGDLELVSAELGLRDVKLAGDVIVNGPTAIAAEVPVFCANQRRE